MERACNWCLFIGRNNRIPIRGDAKARKAQKGSGGVDRIARVRSTQLTFEHSHRKSNDVKRIYASNRSTLLNALIYLKLRSLRRRDEADVVALLRINDPKPVRAYVEQQAQDRLQKFDADLAEAER